MKKRVNSYIFIVIALFLSVIMINNAYALQPPYVSVSPTEDIVTNNNAILHAEYNSSRGGMAKEIGVIVYEDGVELIDYKKAVNSQAGTLKIVFDLKKETGLVLEAGKTYRYTIYVHTAENTGTPAMYRNGHKFTTTLTSVKDSNKVKEKNTGIKASIKVKKKKNKITKKNAKIYVTINNPNKRKISKVKIVVKHKGKKIGTSKIKINSKKKYYKTVNLKINLKKHKIKLKPNKKYEYKVYSYIGKKKYSVKGKFKTK